MKRHHARLVAVAVLVVVLCAGAAFVRLNAKQQIAERREAATRNISTHAAAIDREGLLLASESFEKKRGFKK